MRQLHSFYKKLIKSIEKVGIQVYNEQKAKDARFIHNLFKIIHFYLENRVLLWYSIK